MTQYLSNTIQTVKSALSDILRAGWDRLPPDKASAMTGFSSEWADDNTSKWQLEFWKRHSINILWPSSWLQLLGTLGTVSGGICALAFLGCLLLITAGLASLGVATVITVASFACTIMAAAAFFPLMIIAAISGASAGACITGGLAVYGAHAALQWLHLTPVQPTRTRNRLTDSKAARGPLGFPADQQQEGEMQADLVMKPLGPADMPVSDVSADMHLLGRRPPKVSTAAASAASGSPPPGARGGSTSGVLGDAGPDAAVEEGPEAVSGYTEAAASPAAPPPASLGPHGGSDAAPAPQSASQPASAATPSVSPLSARSTGVDSAAASDSVVSRESWATRGPHGSSAEHGDRAQDGAGAAAAAAGSEQLSAGLLRARPGARRQRVKQGGRKTPPPAPSDVSSSGQASVIDIMDQRFMGGM